MLCWVHRFPKSLNLPHLELSKLGKAVSLCPALNIWDKDAPPESCRLKKWRSTVHNFKKLDSGDVNKVRGLSSSNM